MIDGICTLANDMVFDQVVALLNSIEAHVGAEMPVCIYPYDGRLDRLQELVAERPQVEIFNTQTVIDHWDTWVKNIWNIHPTARKEWPQLAEKDMVHRMGTHRRFCAFEGPFDRFIYMDADTLLLSSPKTIFQALDTVDWVTYDFQYKDISHVFKDDSPQLSEIFPPEQIKRQIFCSGFYGTKKEIFTDSDLHDFLEFLSQGEAAILYPMAPDQTILNYCVMRKPLESVNLALTLPSEQKTGNSVTSTHFQQQGDGVYDKGNRLLYLHYIGVSSRLFARLCQGENLNLPYRDVFLHYRYLHAPESRPEFHGPVVSIQPQNPSIWKRFLRKVNLSQ